MDLYGCIECAAGPKLMSEMRLETPDGKIYGGFFAFRKLVWLVPMLYVMIPLVYFPGSGLVGPWVYRWVASHRYIFPVFNPYLKGQCHL